jgi:hypothetical protein
MALIKTKRGLQRQALQAIHNPPSATQQVRVSKDSQDEKRKMVAELIPFLAMLYKKYLGAQIQESGSHPVMEMISTISKANLKEANIFKHRVSLDPSSFAKFRVNYKKLNPKNVVIDDAFKSQTIWGVRRGQSEAHWKYDTDTYELHFDDVKLQPQVLGLVNFFNRVKDNHIWA